MFRELKLNETRNVNDGVRGATLLNVTGACCRPDYIQGYPCFRGYIRPNTLQNSANWVHVSAGQCEWIHGSTWKNTSTGEVAFRSGTSRDPNYSVWKQ